MPKTNLTYEDIGRLIEAVEAWEASQRFGKTTAQLAKEQSILLRAKLIVIRDEQIAEDGVRIRTNQLPREEVVDDGNP